MSDETEPDEKDAELQRLFKEYEGADIEKQEALGAALFGQAGEWAETRTPTPRDAIQAEFHEARHYGDWLAAEDACRRLIALADSPMLACRDWGDLAEILEEQGRIDDAYQAAQEATKTAREADILPLITVALQTEAAWAEKRGDLVHAHACLDEGLQRMAQSELNLDWQIARFQVHQARLFLAQGELEKASENLKSAEPVLQPYASSLMLAGPLSSLQSWWNVTAQLHIAQGNPTEAKKAAQEALWLARRIAEFPQLAEYDQRAGLRRSLERFANLQDSLGEIEAAEAARQEAQTLK
jgi:tetratricopeptide (TPR) repeat protein